VATRNTHPTLINPLSKTNPLSKRTFLNMPDFPTALCQHAGVEGVEGHDGRIGRRRAQRHPGRGIDDGRACRFLALRALVQEGGLFHPPFVDRAGWEQQQPRVPRQGKGNVLGLRRGRAAAHCHCHGHGHGHGRECSSIAQGWRV
jgi:hypothetical protein